MTYVIRRASSSRKWGLFQRIKRSYPMFTLLKCTCSLCPGHSTLTPLVREEWKCIFGGYATVEEVISITSGIEYKNTEVI